jgi:hypothetical protein
MLEWAEADKARYRELRQLQAAAEGGDEEARGELRRAVRESSPALIARLANYNKDYRRILAHTASSGHALMEDAITERADLLAREVAGPNPTPLEELLADRVASLWVLVELMDTLTSAQLARDAQRHVPSTYLLQMVKLQESANRRYLAAIKALAQVRRLLGPARSVQINVGENQVNVAGGDFNR